jgi:hypothetical protein
MACLPLGKRQLVEKGEYKVTDLRSEMIKSVKAHAKAHIEKHRINVEVYLRNPVGVGEHSDIMDAIEKELAHMAEYEDHLEIINKYFKE